MIASRKRQAGVTLIEALVALAVMAIGMLGIVGVQTSLRANSDLAKQRSEAVRMAQQQVEHFRGFSQLPASSASSPGLGYADFTNGSETLTGSNASYTRSWTFSALAASQAGRTLKVSVEWADRASAPQSVTLATVIAGIAPELGATLTIPGEGDSLRRPSGRWRGIPITAKSLGDGTSGFMPPGAPAGVAWVFNNVTGLIRVCSTSATTTSGLATSNISCGSSYALLLAGYVQYSLGTFPGFVPSSTNIGALPSEASQLIVTVNQTAPSSYAGTAVTCYSSTFDALTLAYYCAMPVVLVPGVPPVWSGSLAFAYPAAPPPAPALAASAAMYDLYLRKACRYQVSGTYTLESRSLLNQNYLMIRAGDGTVPLSCPTPTLLHQPAT